MCLARLQNCYKSITAMYDLFFPLFQREDLSWLSYTFPAIIYVAMYWVGQKASSRFSIKRNGKTRMNFLAHSLCWADTYLFSHRSSNQEGMVLKEMNTGTCT